MPRCPSCGFDVSPALRTCGVCQTELDSAAARAGSPLRSLLDWFLEKLGSGVKHTVTVAPYGELTTRRWTPNTQMLWERSIERPERSTPLKFALWGGRSGPAPKEVAFLDRLLNDLGRLEELARNALAESPEREKWPETARRATFALAGLQADEDEEGVADVHITGRPRGRVFRGLLRRDRRGRRSILDSRRHSRLYA
jgi:hypothetical protein